MKTLILVWTLFKKFPMLLVTSILLITAAGFIEMAGLFSIAPLIDVFLHPDLNNISPITQKFILFFTWAGFEPGKLIFVSIFLILNILQSLFTYFTSYSILKCKYTLIKSLINELYKAFFNANWLLFTNIKKGTLINTFSRELPVIGSSLQVTGNLFSNIFRIICISLVPFYISWQVTLIAIALAGICAIPMFWIDSINYRLGKKATMASNEYLEKINECLDAAKIILGFGNQHKNEVGVHQAFDKFRRVNILAQSLVIGSLKVYEVFVWIIALCVAHLSVAYFSVPVPEMAVCFYALLKMMLIIKIILMDKNSLAGFLPSYEQFQHLIVMAKQNVQKTGKLHFRQLDKVIELKDVGFSYPKHEDVLKNITFDIKKGEMTAFVGESGAGKSTLIDLLMGFYEPNKGTISLDGIPLFDCDIVSFRQRIGYVPQDSILFNTTIRENLFWSMDGATENDIVAACKLANAHEFIVDLADGYETVVGDNGVRLSGGQRQRIALARAMLRKPELLILDEATSSLDSKSEYLVQQAIDKIIHRTTLVVVAHRLSTIKKADKIVVFDKGEIVEIGTHKELLENGSLYKKYHSFQIL